MLDGLPTTKVNNNKTMVMLPGSRVVFSTKGLKSVPCKNHPVFLYIGNHSYLGNKGQGIEKIQVKHEKKIISRLTYFGVRYMTPLRTLLSWEKILIRI